MDDAVVGLRPSILTKLGNKKYITPSGLKTVKELTVGKKRWLKIITTVNTAKRFNKKRLLLRKPQDICKCNILQDEEVSNESTVIYTEAKLKSKKSFNVKERYTIVVYAILGDRKSPGL